MELFSSKPRSFKMDRRSPLASSIKAAISSKLRDFLANYEDDVLAEYIVVLVCNGKHQTQARDDLEAFLGDQSGEFVCWLWKLLSEEICISEVLHGSSDHRAAVNSSFHGDGNKDQKNADTIPDILIHHAKSDEMRYEPSNLTSNFEHPDTVAVSDGFQHGHTRIDETLSEGNDFIAHEVPKYRSYVVRCSPNVEPVAGFEEQPGDESQYQKLIQRNYSESPCRSVFLPEKGRFTSNLQSVTRDDLQVRPLSVKRTTGKRLASVAVDTAPRQIKQPRGSVWDRLGKPCEEEEDSYTRQKKIYDNDPSNLKGDEPSEPQLMWVVPGAKLPKSMGESALFENSGVKSTSNNGYHAKGACDDADNRKRNNQFGGIVYKDNTYSCSGSKGDYLHSRIPLPKLQKSLSTNGNRLESLNEMSRKVPTTTVKNLVLDSSSVPPTSTVNKESGHSNLGQAKDEILDVKSRLHQIQMDMLELRSKQSLVSNDKKFSTPSGVPNENEDDIEARTVLVTNVHFAASREDILLHFSKCGVILKVIILTDCITAQPKGAAFVVFAGKESVDKAVLMSGTSFYSRILTVMRKADMPAGFLAPPAPIGKPVQPRHPQPPRKAPFPRHQYTSTHLQWKRNQPANTENIVSAATAPQQLGTSNALE
ncbi:hypothetical protein J5N97_002483 [Dioscorea zingiberensis]|uniref:RRM domain-containing protein n=1 Tax=Dioscorea zingiberensis TaxID=325984 RepID=A0A9D5D465_9LILI|nr:hypothetical protein J5N97_002483 [Dioscorea zingiberensis]